MKTLLASTLILTSTSLYAHDSCDVELEGGIKLDRNVIEFMQDKKPVYKILENNVLIVDGNTLDLTASQQALVTEYAASIRAMVPEVQTIAIEGIDLAVEGMNLAFDELLGAGNSVGADLTQELTALRDEVKNRFDADKGFYVDEEGFAGEEFFGEEFEQRIESVVEKAVRDSMGSLLIAVGQQMLFSGDPAAFETKMETFGTKIETEMEARGAELEAKAEQLCLSAAKIDKLEEELKTQVSELEAINILTVKNHPAITI
ncbi:YggN family protein [Thalassomonas viridans]|uniref:YggN family protein n=1 Tax=Thalassomonas viridans TaxID=137584 RepID=A0AAF0CAF8_9GAMM|nr:DUF2884 family protein [Thalassomonas viridans]WDE06823.1 YggN family protein [Thalassomonas viridans]